MRFILQQPVQGLILETFGSGNAQSNSSEFLELLIEANNKGVVIVNCTQCLHGRVMMEQYQTGSVLKQSGVISGQDMTPEAAHCKLLYSLSKFKNIEDVKRYMQTNLRGEMSLI